MKEGAVFSKVAVDMYIVQLFWALGYLGVIFAIHLVKLIIRIFNDGPGANSFFDAFFVSSNIFMLVIGIISVAFIKHFISLGVTRKDYFVGGLIAAAGLSVSLPIITAIVTTVENFILKWLNFPLIESSTLDSIERTNQLIGDIFQFIVVSPYVDPENNWLLSIIVISINLFTYYLLGWLISSSFKRLGAFSGLGMIALSILFVLIYDTLIKNALNYSIEQMFFPVHLPLYFSIGGGVILISIVIWIIRKLTKNIIIQP